MDDGNKLETAVKRYVATAQDATEALHACVVLIETDTMATPERRGLVRELVANLRAYATALTKRADRLERRLAREEMH